MSKMNFESDVLYEPHGDTYIADISSNVSSKDSLLLEMSQKLLFPDYFGSGWDALYDCLTDLSWLREKNVFIIFESLLKLDDVTKNILFETLKDVVQFWNENSDLHNVDIIIKTV